MSDGVRLKSSEPHARTVSLRSIGVAIPLNLCIAFVGERIHAPFLMTVILAFCGGYIPVVIDVVRVRTLNENVVLFSFWLMPLTALILNLVLFSLMDRIFPYGFLILNSSSFVCSLLASFWFWQRGFGTQQLKRGQVRIALWVIPVLVTTGAILQIEFLENPYRYVRTGWNQIVTNQDEEEYFRLGFNIARYGQYSFSIVENSGITNYFHTADARSAFFAQRLIQSDTVTHPNQMKPTAYRSPGYPVFLSIFCSLFPRSSIFAARIANCVLLGLAVWLTLSLTIQIFGDTLSALLPGFFFLSMPELFFAAEMLWTETLSLLMISVFLFTAVTKLDQLRSLFVIGIQLALIVLVRPNYIFLVGPLALFLWMELKAPARRTKFTIILAGFLVCMLPWWLRNVYTFKRVIPFTTMGGYALFCYNNDEAVRTHGGWSGGRRELFLKPNLSEPDLDRYWLLEWKKWAANHPWEQFKLFLLHLTKAWYSGMVVFSEDLVQIRNLPYTMTLFLAPAGLWVARRERWARLGFFLLAGYWLQSILFLQARFLFPLFPVIALAATRALRIRWKKPTLTDCGRFCNF